MKMPKSLILVKCPKGRIRAFFPNEQTAPGSFIRELRTSKPSPVHSSGGSERANRAWFIQAEVYERCFRNFQTSDESEPVQAMNGRQQ